MTKLELLALLETYADDALITVTDGDEFFDLTPAMIQKAEVSGDVVLDITAA